MRVHARCLTALALCLNKPVSGTLAVGSPLSLVATDLRFSTALSMFRGATLFIDWLNSERGGVRVGSKKFAMRAVFVGITILAHAITPHPTTLLVTPPYPIPTKAILTNITPSHPLQPARRRIFGRPGRERDCCRSPRLVSIVRNGTRLEHPNVFRSAAGT